MIILFPTDLQNPDNLDDVYMILERIQTDVNLDAPVAKAIKSLRALGETKLAARMARGELQLDL